MRSLTFIIDQTPDRYWINRILNVHVADIAPRISSSSRIHEYFTWNSYYGHVERLLPQNSGHMTRGEDENWQHFTASLAQLYKESTAVNIYLSN